MDGLPLPAVHSTSDHQHPTTVPTGRLWHHSSRPKWNSNANHQPASQPASLTTILMIVDQAWGLTTNDNNWPTPSSINCHRDGRKGQPKAKYDLLSCHRLLPAIFDGSIWLLVACGCLQLIVVLDICQLQAATCLPYLQFKLPWEHHRVYVGYISHWAINPNQRVSQFTCQK